MPFLKDKYSKEIIPQFVEKFGIKNILAAPVIKKITLNIGLGVDATDKKFMQAAMDELSLITGQKPAITKAKSSIAGFKIRRDQNLGVKVTLRGKKMYEFLERLIYIALPRIRDFRGLSSKAFDKNYNYNIGIKEHGIFIELPFSKILKSRGVNISFTLAGINSVEQGTYFLSLFNFPLK